MSPAGSVAPSNGSPPAQGPQPAVDLLYTFDATPDTDLHWMLLEAVAVNSNEIVVVETENGVAEWRYVSGDIHSREECVPPLVLVEQLVSTPPIEMTDAADQFVHLLGLTPDEWEHFNVLVTDSGVTSSWSATYLASQRALVLTTVATP